MRRRRGDGGRQEFASLCLALEENDPNTTRARLDNQLIYLSDDDVLRFGRALTSNTMITALEVAIPERLGASVYHGVCQFLASAPQLEELRIEEHGENEALEARLIAAISRNRNIRKLILNSQCARHAHLLSICFESLKGTLRELELYDNGLSPHERGHFNATELNEQHHIIAGAVRRLQNLESLKIFAWTNSSEILSGFLTGLSIGPPIKLQRLEVRKHFSAENVETEFIGSVRAALACMPALQTLCFNVPLEIEDSWNILTDCIQAHPGICDLAIGIDRRALLQIVHLISEKDTLKRLLVHAGEGWASARSILEAITDHPSLEAFHLEFKDMKLNFEAKQIELGSIVPRIKGVKEFGLYVSDYHPIPLPEHIPSELFQGFENNSSFTSVKLDWHKKGTQVHQAIDFYTARNKHVGCLLAASKSDMFSAFVDLFAEYDNEYDGYPETALAVVFVCLRSRDDWRHDLY